MENTGAPPHQHQHQPQAGTSAAGAPGASAGHHQYHHQYQQHQQQQHHQAPPLLRRTAEAPSSGSEKPTMADLSSMTSLEEVLEKQWEMGAQYFMEQAQHFDIASLLSCLHKLKKENVELEDKLEYMLRRRNNLLAVNARLVAPLGGYPQATGPPEPAPQPTQVQHRQS